MATLEEQETIITQNRADDFISIYTSNTNDLRYFFSKHEFKLVRAYTDVETNETCAAEFRLPKDRANIRKILKRQVSPEQRESLANRLSTIRKSN